MSNLGTDCTNNTAEYMGLVLSLLLIQLTSLNSANYDIRLFSDSELLCKQMQGVYAVKAEHIIILHAVSNKLYKKIPKINIKHVLREYNTEADALSTKGKSLRLGTFEILY